MGNYWRREGRGQGKGRGDIMGEGKGWKGLDRYETGRSEGKGGPGRREERIY